MKKLFIAFLSLLFSTLPLSACKNPDDGKTTVKISEVTHSVFYAPLYLADALGYFGEENITVELSNGGGADNVMSAVLSGGADVGFCGPEAALYVLVGGSTDVPKVFGQLTKRDGSFLVSRKAEPDFKWTDLRGKEILAGRKGGVPAMTFEYVLKNSGLSPANNADVTLNYDVAFNLMTGAFEAGTADYCTMFEPTASEYQAAGKGYIVASVGEASGEVPYTCFCAKNSWLEKNETTAKGLLRAVTKAVKYALETEDSRLAELLKPYFDGTSETALAASVKSYKKIDAWMKNPAMTEDSLNRLQDIISGAGELTRRVTLAELTKNDLAEAVYKEVFTA